ALLRLFKRTTPSGPAMLRQHTPSHELCPERTLAALSLADARARRLARSWSLQPADREDARQAILLDVVARSHRFDPQRGSWSAFVHVVSRHAALDLTRKMRRQREADVSAADQCGGCDPAEGLHLRLDLHKALRRLPTEAQRIVGLIANASSVTDAQQCSALPPASFYRSLRDLRLRLIAAGVRPSVRKRLAA
ncbi:MAG: sigma factor, partial [Legionella sp.]|nr:sigma factor [Legionella sp.]